MNYIGCYKSEPLTFGADNTLKMSLDQCMQTSLQQGRKYMAVRDSGTSTVAGVSCQGVDTLDGLTRITTDKCPSTGAGSYLSVYELSPSNPAPAPEVNISTPLNPDLKEPFDLYTPMQTYDTVRTQNIDQLYTKYQCNLKLYIAAYNTFLNMSTTDPNYSSQQSQVSALNTKLIGIANSLASTISASYQSHKERSQKINKIATEISNQIEKLKTQETLLKDRHSELITRRAQLNDTNTLIRQRQGALASMTLFTGLMLALIAGIYVRTGTPSA